MIELLVALYLLACAGSGILVVIALYNLLWYNRVVHRHCMDAYNRGSPFHTFHGMVLDSKTGEVRPHDTPIVSGKRLVTFPLLVGGWGLYLLLGGI